MRVVLLSLTGVILCGLLSAGCSSTKVTDVRQTDNQPQARPQMVWVAPFASAPDEVHPESALADQFSDQDDGQTAEHVAMGRQLSMELATELVMQIRNMGMPAALTDRARIPATGDLLVTGQILSFDEGSELKRLAIGLGSGQSSMCVAAQTFLLTPDGLEEFGGETIDAGSKKSPGLAIGLAGFVATKNPAGLILSTTKKAYGEMSGRSKVTGRAKDTAGEIASGLKTQFKRAGWIN